MIFGERDHATAVILLLKQPSFTLHLLCITKRCQTNAVATRARRYEITEQGDKMGRVWNSLVDMCWREGVGWGGVGGLLCVGSVCALLFKTKADHTGRQTSGGAECLSLSSQ